MIKKTLIFSDVHLMVGDDDRSRQEAFVAFLRRFTPEEFDRIICVGDLFDFWFEYKQSIFSGHFEVLRAFAALHEAGIELHLICGNHDFWAGRFLHDQLGFQVHPDQVILPFGEKKALFLHGDGLNPADWKYRLFKRFARIPLVVGAFRMLHPDWAMAIARALSHGSRNRMGVQNPAEGPEALALKAHAKTMLAEGAADVVCFGHAHATANESYPTPTGEGRYLNAGDWMNHGSYIIWDGEDFQFLQDTSVE